MNVEQLKADLCRDEGEVLHAYRDSLGYLTIGVGRLIDPRRNGGISHDEAMYLLGNDIDRVQSDLNSRISFWPELDGVRQRALCNMAFQLGTNGLMQFKHMLRALESRDYQKAHDEALDSAWARQTPARAKRIAHMLLTGQS